MGRKPKKYYTIDRIDSTKDYYPENCRWATLTQQMINRGNFKNNTSGVKGVIRGNNKWRAYIHINGHKTMLGTFTTFEEAVEARKKAELAYY
jgi:hypothetical protein